MLLDVITWEFGQKCPKAQHIKYQFSNVLISKYLNKKSRVISSTQMPIYTGILTDKTMDDTYPIIIDKITPIVDETNCNCKLVWNQNSIKVTKVFKQANAPSLN